MKPKILKRMTHGILLGGAALSILGAGQTALATESDDAYKMAVIIDAAQGRKVHRGDYENAISRLTDEKRRYPDEFARQNNLCVAYTKTGNLDRAEQACDAAFDYVESKGERAIKGAFTSEARANGYRVYKAVALSNRGVVRALQGDVKLALRDFEQANGLKARVRGTKSNLARLNKAVATSS